MNFPSTTTDPRLKCAVIVGTPRRTKSSSLITQWLTKWLAAQDIFDVDLIDLASTPLPYPPEPTPAFLKQYESSDLRDYATRIDAADAFIVITPEYNHGYPASLKHAIDAVYLEWRAKPIAFVSYGGAGGGVRAVEQLRQVFVTLNALTLKDTVTFFNGPGQPFMTAGGEPADQDTVAAAAEKMHAELIWWATSLKEARLVRPHPPGI